MAPIASANNVFIQNVNQQVACQTSVKIKQLSMRLSTFSGAFNLAFTLGYGLITKNALGLAFDALVTPQTCASLGK